MLDQRALPPCPARPSRFWLVCTLLLSAACGSSSSPSGEDDADGATTTDAARAEDDGGAGSGGGGTGGGGGGGLGGAAATDAGSATADLDGGGGSTSVVHFAYHPEWAGVSQVAVFGSFGRPDDWKMPFLTLTADDKGTWRGMATVPAGTYTYLFRITGDASAKAPTTYIRFAIDPHVSAFQKCPKESPSASNENNPCSVLTVPQPAADPVHHVKGTATLGGTAAKDWLVLVERQEAADSHHFFANRTNLDATGAFDFTVAPGSYRIQLLPGDDMKTNDADLKPLEMPWARRVLSNAFAVKGDTMLDPAELDFPGYAAMAPRDGKPVTLPATLTFTLLPHAVAAHASLYGPGTNVGDPWWNGKTGTATTAVFEGTFDTMKGMNATAKPGESYWWDTWQVGPKSKDGVFWTRQGMIFPITFK